MLLVELEHTAVPVEVDAAVAHGNPLKRCGGGQHSQEGGAALVNAAGTQHPVDAFVDITHHLQQHAVQLGRLEPGGQGEHLHDHPLAHLLAAGEAAHAVGHHGQDALPAEDGGLAAAVLLAGTFTDVVGLAHGGGTHALILDACGRQILRGLRSRAGTFLQGATHPPGHQRENHHGGKIQRQKRQENP